MRELLRFCADPWREERTQPSRFPRTEFEQPGRTETTPFASSECQVTAVHFFQGRLNSTRRPNRATLQVLETSRCSSKVAWRVGERKPCFIAETTSQGVIPHTAFCAQPATEHCSATGRSFVPSHELGVSTTPSKLFTRNAWYKQQKQIVNLLRTTFRPGGP